MINNIAKKITIIILVLSIGISFFIIASNLLKNGEKTPFAAFIAQNKKIKILIVPGHEPKDGGASFGKINERDLNLQLSKLLKDDLEQNTNLEVMLARDDSGWNSDLSNYVETSSTTIMNWVTEMKKKMLAKVSGGKIEIIDPNMKHNEATSNAVLFLYGTNKWIEKNSIDLVLHVHFNNNPKINGKPNFQGYCMYIPEHQYSNSSSSRIFANYLDAEISKIEKKSNMLQEKDIIIEDQQLIATGNYNTLKIPSVVIEYSYIYEPIMVSSSTRNKFIFTAASSTAIAIKNYIRDIVNK